VSGLEKVISSVESAVGEVQKTISRITQLERSILVHAIRDASSASPGLVPLSLVSEVRLGRQRSPKNHGGEYMRPYLRAANVGWGGLLLEDVKQMNFAPREQDTYRLALNDIVLSEASGSPNEVGKPAIWRGELTDCCFQNTLLRVRVTGTDVEPRYLLAFFRMLALTGAFARASRGVGIHHLGAQALAAWPVPLPRAAEQRQLVVRIDQALASIARLRKELHLTLTRATNLRKAIVTAAFTGRLPIRAELDHAAAVELPLLVAGEAN
jgi:type I restriction enzyme S subunit